MTSLDAGKLAHEAKAKQLVLTHLPHYGRLKQLKEEAAKQYAGQIQLAYFGQHFQI